MRLFLLSLATLLVATVSAQEVILTGILDGDLLNSNNVGGNPKVIELYVNGTVNLENYQLSRTNNSNVFTFPAGSTYTDAFVYVVNPAGEQEYIQAFGNGGDFANYYLSSDIAGNGNDPYQLLDPSGTVLDQTGGPIGASNNYKDGHRYRNNNTGPDGGWVEANWSGGNGTVDNQPVSAYASITMFGTYGATPPGPSVIVTSTSDGSEDGVQGEFEISLSQPATSQVSINFSLGGTATEDVDYTTNYNAPSWTFQPGQSGPIPVTLTIVDDNVSEPTETVTLTITSVSDATYSAGASAEISIFDNEPVSTLNIATVQGNSQSTPLEGQTVTVDGIVVGDFQGGTGVGLGGFFVQEQDANSDNDPQTSDGIWVYDNGTAPDVNVGDLVVVTGVAEESNQLTQINVTGAGSSVNILSTNNTLPTAAQLDLPVASGLDYEAVEGMLTTVVDDVTVTDTYNLGRYGEFEVSEGGRLVQYTECNNSSASGLAAHNAQQNSRRLIVDDGRSGDNAFPITLGDGMNVTASNTLRSGTVISGLTGIVDERFTGYRFQATDFTRQASNPRPAGAPNVGGNLTVVGMNVLNYFTSLGQRGADNSNEFDRQEAKIVAAINALDADILGLVEIENNGFGANGALQTLIDAIAAAGGPSYSFVNNPNPGGDQIMVALIYKTDVVEESGNAANLTVSAGNFGSNRIPLAQTFRVIDSNNPNFGQEVTVCVNHWKSKGSSCGSGDDDNGGAGNCNGTRNAAATTIANWLNNDDPTGTGETDQLIIGDLNAYSQEQPLLTLEANGFTNLVRDNTPASSFPCGSTPSYVFKGEWGSLDHAFGSGSITSKVTGASAWNVNAAEPRALDYDTDFNDPSLYAADFYRFSDHDPVVVGLDLGASLPVELTSFRGSEFKGDVKLDWTTSTEINTAYFEVLRRTANETFTSIGRVAAAGDSESARAYTFTDRNAVVGDNTYRLRTVDIDGAVNMSNVLTVTLAQNGVKLSRTGTYVYRLSGATPGDAYQLISAGGTVVRRGVFTSEAEDVDGSNLPSGIYFLTVGQETFKLVW